jgi:glucosamine-phosphate N-acetyltransferase
MDTNIYYTNLNEFVANNLDKIEIIKNKYLNLLSMLTITTDLDSKVFINILDNINKNSLIYIACVSNINDINNFNIIGTGTILIENKFIHGGMNVGHIEDIVVHENYRKNGIAKNIIEALIENGKKRIAIRLF